jgi:hypothetical protein
LTVLCHVGRWKAEYRLVPDEQDQIEAVLRDLVSAADAGVELGADPSMLRLPDPGRRGTCCLS